MTRIPVTALDSDPAMRFPHNELDSRQWSDRKSKNTQTTALEMVQQFFTASSIFKFTAFSMHDVR
jgi:hypothetical protein